VFVIDLTDTTRPADLSMPATLPAGITSVTAEEAVEMGSKLTRVTIRLKKPVTLQASASDKSVIITMPAVADALYAKAAASTACATPWIALNELFGSALPTPWSATKR